MLAPVAAGIAAGIIGFLPLFISLRLARRSTSLSAMSAGLYGLAGTFVSLIVVAVALIVCAMVARDVVLPFGVAEIVALIVSTCSINAITWLLTVFPITCNKFGRVVSAHKPS